MHAGGLELGRPQETIFWPLGFVAVVLSSVKWGNNAKRKEKSEMRIQVIMDISRHRETGICNFIGLVLLCVEAG